MEVPIRILVAGGSGHIGSYLVPRLVRAGHEVINLTRGSSSVYVAAPEWEQVTQVVADRAAADVAGTFGEIVLAHRPEVVVDLVCFTLESASALVESVRGEVDHLLHCGSIWRYGPSQKLPIVEGEGTPAFGEYGVQKEAIARMLLHETASLGLVTTTIHPGHIVGPGWTPIGPLGNRDPDVWETLATGRTLHTPGSGAEAMHHVHADDVAQVFERAIHRREAAAGEEFHAVAPAALTVRGFAKIAAGWFGEAAVLKPVPWERFLETTTPDHARTSWGHLHRSHALSIEKARLLLGYVPAYEAEAAVLESLRWLLDHGELRVSRALTA